MLIETKLCRWMQMHKMTDESKVCAKQGAETTPVTALSETSLSVFEINYVTRLSKKKE